MDRLTAGKPQPQSMRARDRGARGVALAALLACSGCDIVQGFENAGNALFPPEKTHLDAPGIRLVKGPFRRLDIAAGTDIFLLARSSDDADTALYVMRYAAPVPCSIPNVIRYEEAHGTLRDTALVAYLEENVAAGTLRFADADCVVGDFSVEGAHLPFDELERGFVLIAGGDLVVVDPSRRSVETVAKAVEAIDRNAFSGGHVVRAGGRLGLFRTDWTEIGWFGEGVVRLESVGRSLFYEGSGGIHRLVPSGSTFTDSVVAADGCALRSRASTWALYREPCDGGQVKVYREKTGVASALPFEVQTNVVRLQSPASDPEADPGKDPFWFYYLRNVDEATGLGTLVLRNLEREEHEIGSFARLDRVSFSETPSVTQGYALVDIQGGLGRYVHFAPDGTVTDLATGVLDQDALITDYDVVTGTGNFAMEKDAGIGIIARRVPPSEFQISDSKQRWTTVFHEFDGESGRLSVVPGKLAVEESEDGLIAPRLKTVAENVRHRRTRFMDTVLPGVAYFTRFDADTQTSRLEYTNYELDFTSIVSDGVADFLLTPDSIIYTVPFGKNAGIWLVRAK
jgi:hypothetical protein